MHPESKNDHISISAEAIAEPGTAGGVDTNFVTPGTGGGGIDTKLKPLDSIEVVAEPGTAGGVDTKAQL